MGFKSWGVFNKGKNEFGRRLLLKTKEVLQNVFTKI
jgi:hypothetical protein